MDLSSPLATLQGYWALLDQHPLTSAALGLVILLAVAWIVGRLARFLVRRAADLLARQPALSWLADLRDNRVFQRLAQTVPSLVVQFGLALIPNLTGRPEAFLRNLAMAVTALFLLLALSALLDALLDIYARTEHARTRSIKGYVQLAKLFLFVFGGIVVVSILIDRSPMLLLSGLGAMSAVLLLVYKDTLLSFVASVQLTSNDMLRVGDWIEMPQVGADGDVVDITLHTVKVQNWDKTITTIPTWKLMSDSFKNWRGMFNSGGRRILRAIHIDAATVHLLTAQERQTLSGIALLKDYWTERDGLLAQPDAAANAMPTQAIAPDMVTNLAAFKAYAYAYLMAHPRISKAPGMFLLARTLEPSPTGIPLQLHCYTATTVWVEYEGIQGEIFDHLIGVMPLFGLSLYQRSSDYSNRQIVQALSDDDEAHA